MSQLRPAKRVNKPTQGKFWMELPNGFTPVQIARCISSKRLELTILPTEKCNFRCTYCYEDFAIGRMPRSVVDGVKNLITSRAPDLEELQISWFGGEPLLAMTVIQEISAHAFELSGKLGFHFDGGLTTNGYLLTTETLAELVSLNQNFFQVSLDGWREQHDVTRRRADGVGTFDVIWQNLLAAKQTALSFEMLLRIHLTNDNFDSLKTLCSEIRKEFSGDQRFRMDFQDVRDLGGEGGKSVTPLGAREFKARVAELLAISKANYEESLQETLIIEPEKTLNFDIDSLDTKTGESASGRRAFEVDAGTPYICYASKPNHFLIRGDGRVGKCTVALDHPRNTLGKINPDGTIEVDQALARRWYGGLETFDIDQLGCPLPFVTKEREVDASRLIPAVVE
jgi:uncharacterized protein